MKNNFKSYLAADTVEYYKSLAKRGLFSYERALINKYFIQGSCILDIGCGAGRTTVALSNLGYDVNGIDYSIKMIEAARGINSKIKYSVQNVRNLNFSEKTFDGILFSFNGLMLLETYQDRMKALAEINRVLKNGGIFFFTTPFLDNKLGLKYWAEKIKQYGKKIEQFSNEELMGLGDERTEEGDVAFFIHIPFVSEVQKMLWDNDFEILFAGRRLDKFLEEEIEEELDDNYLWVVKKNCVHL